MIAASEQIRFVQGNEACALGALDSGAEFFAGYPITPSSEIAEICARVMPQKNGVYLQMEDEIASIAAVIGASLSGVKAFTATSGPGFSLMQENIGFAVYAEVPCVIINVQRHGPSTGMATRPAQMDVMQARWGTHGDHPIIVLAPASVQESYDLTIKAFSLAEKYRSPVIVLSDEVVAHMREKLVLHDNTVINIYNRQKPHCQPEEYQPFQADVGDVPYLAAYGDPHLMHVTSTCHDESGYSNFQPQVAEELNKRLHRKIYKNLSDILLYKKFGPPNSEVTIISYGITCRAARAAADRCLEKGLTVGVLQLQTLWPFPDKVVEDVLKESKLVLVPEMNMGQVVGEIRRVNDWQTKVIGMSRTDGNAITPNQIVSRIKEAL